MYSRIVLQSNLVRSIKKSDIKREENIIKLISSSVYPWKYSWMIKLSSPYCVFVSTNGNRVNFIPSGEVDIKINSRKKVNGTFYTSINIGGNTYRGVVTLLSRQRYEAWKAAK